MEEISIPCKFQKDVVLKDKTWIHRGGMVSYWLQPEDIDEIIAVGRMLYQANEPFVTIGHTSNTYFLNSFNIKYVIDTRHLKGFYELDDSTLVCECGAPMAKVSRYCVERGIAGYEGMVGLPGTVGGGIFCNSGCYGCGIDSTLKEIELLTTKGEVKRLSAQQLDFDFRTSAMKKGVLQGIILRGYFDISRRLKVNQLISIAEKNTADRKETQDPPAQNLGSTLNTHGIKGGLRNNIIKLLIRINCHVTKDKQKRYAFRKRMICLLYNAKSIEKYISDKRMNCFIWRDECADDAYPLYLEMMNKVYLNCIEEI